MNNNVLPIPYSKITTYRDLQEERAQLERQIDNQKNIIRHDLDELKAEFKKEIRPAIDAAEFIKKLAKPETRNRTILSIGANLAVDLALRGLLGRSNLIVQLLLPKVIKNYATHLLTSFKSKPMLNRTKAKNKQAL